MIIGKNWRFSQRKKGQNTCIQMLTEVDPKSALQIIQNNIKRTIRALEFLSSDRNENIRT